MDYGNHPSMNQQHAKRREFAAREGRITLYRSDLYKGDQ